MIDTTVALIKEVIELGLRSVSKAITARKAKYSTSELNDVGFKIFENFLTPNQCEELRGLVDTYLTSGGANVWHDPEGADNRIYFADKLNSGFKEIYEHSDLRDSLAEYTGIKNPAGLLLAAKINFVEGNQGSGGGWHRDSPFTHQFKAIIYLSDVEENNGPFQYIKGSNSKLEIVKCYLKNVFKPGQYRFSEQEIDGYLKFTNKKVTDLTAKMGTLVLTDTKGIHRGRPIETGCRYTLFCYFWSQSIPEHFKQYDQKN